MSEKDFRVGGEEHTKKPLLIGFGVGFAIAAALALIIGLAVGLHHHHSENLSKKALNEALIADHWDEVLCVYAAIHLIADSCRRRASGTTVRWWFWGLDPEINDFVARIYGKPLFDEYNIVLDAVHLNATALAVQQVSKEYAEGNTKNGSVDLIWINGENFYAMKQAMQLWGPFAHSLPLASTVDYQNSAIAYDFGESIDGLESVWSQAQYQFIYDPSRTPTASLPRSFADWIQYARDHPGAVTYVYPDAADFLGTRFIKQALLDLAPKGYFAGSDFNQTKFDTYAPLLWQELNAVKPYLWQNGTALPDTTFDQDYLFGHGETDFTVTNDVTGAQTGIDEGRFPAGSKAYIWHTNCIGDFNYVAIPGNSPHVPAALVLANLILRPDRQALQKIPSEGFALGYGIDYSRLDSAGQTVLNLADQLLGNASVDSAELAKYLVGDLNPLYHKAVVDGWLTNVGPGVSVWNAP